MAGNSVYLNVSEALINELGTPASKTRDDFLAALKVGPPGLTGQGRPGYVCDKALKLLQDWREKDFVYPPYIAYLALFVLAANKDGDYSIHAYHPRLRQLLDPNDESKAFFPSFEKTYQLWSDLEQWATKDQQGQLGLFNADIVGNHFHIGLPRGQILLTETELKKLPDFFAAAGLTNDSQPSDNELLSLLVQHGGSALRDQTKYLLQHDAQAQEIIARIVSDRLWDWDNTDSRNGQQRSFGSLFLSLESIDEFAGTVSSRIHLKSRQALSEDRVRFTVDELQLFSDLGATTWSNPITRTDTHQAISGDTFAWDRSVKLVDETGRCCFSWVGSPVRIFVNGSAFGVNGMAEVKQLPPEAPFWLAANASARSDIAKWASDSCEGFRQLNVDTGLPSGWGLFAVSKVLDDSKIKAKYPMLALPVGARFQLLDGIAIRGNRYFSFAPPTVAVTYDNSESFVMLCDGTPLSGYCKEGRTYFELPSENALDRYLRLELQFNGQITQTRYIYLDTQCEVPSTGERFYADSRGQRTDSKSYIAGPAVHASTPPCPFALFGMEEVPARLYFIGSNPGEICSYARTGYPEDWEPTWCMINGRKIKVFPCEYTAPEHNESACSSKQRKRWCELLWHRRRRFSLTSADKNTREKWAALRRSAHNERQ